ncbi:MAG: CoB--CoM heterodisulfide reductase subunit C [Promethearchaeia archaeon]|nr:MAG: CoB--CoM heterodisulfide reductase subunit C [Candidatus Lokiarchaeia archaeon]
MNETKTIKLENIHEEFPDSERKFRVLADFTPEFFADIERRTNILSCIQCGTCTASCESGRWTALKTRLIIRRLIFGDLTVLEDPDIWLCTTCYNCYERCPRDVRPTDVIIELRNYASKLGNMHPVHRKVVDFLKVTGHAVPINAQIRQQRKELGLDELPPTLYRYKDEPDSEMDKYAKELFNLADANEKVQEKLQDKNKIRGCN